jgi:hypothetical protein
VLAVVITPANVQDRDGAIPVLMAAAHITGRESPGCRRTPGLWSRS